MKLVVENLALIDKLDLDLEPGLVVLSGETGAGKSLVLDALSLILGYRASVDLIRTGAERARVQAVFEVTDLPPEYSELIEDGQLIIAREVNANGRSTARINGQLVTIGTLRDLGKLLVDLHGQHEHQSLLQVAKHGEMLDRFAGSQTAQLLISVANVATKHRQVNAKLRALVGDGREQVRRLELLRFQQEEIAAAALEPDEEDELLSKSRRLANYERLHNAVGEAYELLSLGSDTDPAVCDQLAATIAELTAVERYDQELQSFAKILQEALYNIEDVARSLRVYRENLTFDTGALQTVEKRLDLLNSLKRKYADTIAGIIEYSQKIEAEIIDIENSGELIAALQAELKQLTADYTALAAQLTDQRLHAAANLQQQVAEQFADLGLEAAVLAADVRTATDIKPHHLGQDEIEFMFNANPGESPKQLTKVISGGEMSRVMLALKTLLAEHDPVDTLVFDEIDSGLGGRLAVAVGAKLRELAAKRQVICVSHLANIAAVADQHLLINKEIRGAATFTNVRVLNANEREKEIARMLDGQMSDIALEHARELLRR